MQCRPSGYTRPILGTTGILTDITYSTLGETQSKAVRGNDE